MSDSTFNMILTFIFSLAFSYNCFVLYKITSRPMFTKTRTIIIDRSSKNQIQGVCDLGEDDWKEIKAETL